MGYVENDLISGEKITYQGRLHWITILVPALITGAFWIVGIGLIVAGVTAKEGNGKPLIIAGALVFVFGDVPLLTAWIQRRSSEFAVTNKRVIVKTGVIYRKTTELFLEKVESVGVDQGIFARMLDYGTVTFRGTGGTFEPFPRIARPLEFRRQVQEQIAALGSKSSAATSG